MAAGLMGAGGGGTISPGFRPGSAMGGCGSGRGSGWVGDADEGPRGGVGGKLQLARSRGVRVDLLPPDVARGDGGWPGGRDDERVSLAEGC